MTKRAVCALFGPPGHIHAQCLGLSTKVFQGACRLIQMGFKQGGAAGFGLRRMLIDQAGQPKGTLKIGEQKSLQTDRVVLVPGPEEEQDIVRSIYRAFLDEGKSEREIADELNARKITTDLGRTWTRGTIHQVLTNEKYIGNNVYHRTSCKLKRKHVSNPPEMWIRADNAFPAVVDAQVFFRAQEAILARAKRYSNAEMLSALKDLWSRHGRISGLLIDEQEAMPSSAAFRNRFGSLIRAYELIGYSPGIDYSFVEINRYLRGRHPEIVQEVIGRLAAMGVSVERDPVSELLVLDHELTVSVILSRALLSAALGVAATKPALRKPSKSLSVRSPAASTSNSSVTAFAMKTSRNPRLSRSPANTVSP